MQPKFDDFAFLTDERKRNFRLAIEAANKFHASKLAGRAHIYEQSDPVSFAYEIRNSVLSHCSDIFSGDPTVKRRSINNMEGLEFDQEMFVQFRKILDPNVPPPESKTLMRARFERSGILLPQEQEEQLPLFEDYFTLEEQLIPLRELYPVVGGYIIDDKGYVQDFHLMDVVYNIKGEGTTKSFITIDLVGGAVASDQLSQELPKPRLSLKLDKSSDRKKAQA